MGCSGLTSLKLGYNGRITLGRTIFGNNQNSKANAITLYLQPDVSPAPNKTTKIWHGYMWKEILDYE
jgi:hypothetical protein